MSSKKEDESEVVLGVGARGYLSRPGLLSEEFEVEQAKRAKSAAKPGEQTETTEAKGE